MKNTLLFFFTLLSINLSAQVYKFTIGSNSIKLETVNDSLKNTSTTLFTDVSLVEIHKNSSKVVLGTETLSNLNLETIQKYKDMDGVDGLVDYSLKYSVEGNCVEFYYYTVYTTCSGLSMSELPIDNDDWTIELQKGDKTLVYNITDYKFN